MSNWRCIIAIGGVGVLFLQSLQSGSPKEKAGGLASVPIPPDGTRGEPLLSRPVQSHIAPQTRTGLALAAAQARWEASAHDGPVTRDDVGEELPSKAEANRARVAFLSQKGATMQGWSAHCAAVTAPQPVTDELV